MTFVHKNMAAVPAGTIDLGRGHPSPSLLPTTLMRRAAELYFERDDGASLQYGHEQGDPKFRHALAEFLSAHYQTSVCSENLLVTSGASAALGLICTLFAKPGDTVFVEEPSYFLALRIFADHQLNVVSLPVDDNGILVDALEERLSEIRPAFLYTVPTFQYPTGITLSRERRDQLVSLCFQHGILIVADEVYHLLSYGALPPPPLAIHMAAAPIISLGSFSKILAPGLRLGWVQTNAHLLEKLISGGLLQSGGGLNPFTSAVVGYALEDGLLGKHLIHLKNVYQARAEGLSAALREFPDGLWSFEKPAGGYFLWLRMPLEVDAEELLERSSVHGLRFQPGRRFSSRGSFNNYARLSFSYYEEPVLRQGVGRLQSLVK